MNPHLSLDFGCIGRRDGRGLVSFNITSPSILLAFACESYDIP